MVLNPPRYHAGDRLFKGRGRRTERPYVSCHEHGHRQTGPPHQDQGEQAHQRIVQAALRGGAGRGGHHRLRGRGQHLGIQGAHHHPRDQQEVRHHHGHRSGREHQSGPSGHAVGHGTVRTHHERRHIGRHQCNVGASDRLLPAGAVPPDVQDGHRRIRGDTGEGILSRRRGKGQGILPADQEHQTAETPGSGETEEDQDQLLHPEATATWTSRTRGPTGTPRARACRWSRSTRTDS